MYRDNTLIPSEAIRMLALGILTQGPKRYGALAGEVRHFAQRVVGPSLDILGTSIELLRYEELVVTSDGTSANDDALLTITDKGRAALTELLSSNVRAPIDDINKLIVACKIWFLDVLPIDEQRAQLDGLAVVCDIELGRLEDLLAHHQDEPGHLAAWLEHDIGQLRARISWLQGLRDEL